MCAMALNHARIEKLFYSISHKSDWGGCNCDTKIFHDENLNHKYKVWRYFELEKTEEVYKKIVNQPN